MGKMCKGIDISHWNYSRLNEVVDRIYADETLFVMIKVTEGKSYVDVRAKEYFERAVDAGVYVGFYHYCRPDKGNRARDEAKHFLNTVNSIIAGKSEKVALCIDWEGDSIGHEIWLSMFVDEIKKQTGVNPILYVSQSNVYKCGEVLNVTDVGLWVARWGREPMDVGDIFPWKICAFHQYGKDVDIDVNVFNGDCEQLAKYFEYYYHSEDADKEEIGHCCSCCKCCSSEE